MIEKFVELSISSLKKNELIDDTEEELYRFGFKQLFLFGINIITALLIGILCHMIWQSILFSAAYIPLRRFAGGYHAKTPGICYFLSTLLVFFALQIIQNFYRSYVVILAVIAVSAIAIFHRAPVESKNKPLSDAEKTVFKRKSRIILLIEITAAAALLPIHMEAAICIAVAIACSGVMLVIAR